MQNDAECWFKVNMQDTNQNTYWSEYHNCTKGVTEISVKYTATGGTTYEYKLEAEGEPTDLGATYTWDGSYTDPTYCDNETQKQLTDDEFAAQEDRCILNGILCSWSS